MVTTLDGLLNRRIALEQPQTGYRVAIDTVFVAAAVPAGMGEQVLELGSGAGGAMLCLAARVPEINITGIEIENEFLRLCRDNIARNKFTGRLKTLFGDAANLPEELAGKFDHVLMNPPYHEEARHDVSLQAAKRKANTEKEGGLALWLASAAKALKPSGTLTLIHRADRQDEILALLQNSFGAIEVLPLAPKAGQAPKRIVLRAQKDAPFAIKVAREFVLHEAAGGFTAAAEAILRDGKPLFFD